MKKKQFFSNLTLVLTAMIWGSAFVAQSEGTKYVDPFTFNAIRNIIGGLVLLPCIYLIKKIGNKGNIDVRDELVKSKEKNDEYNKNLIIGGIFCGLALFLGSTFQQIGIKYTTAGKSGFITALYIVIVPMLGVIIGKKPTIKICFSVLIAIIGFYFLCISGKFSICKGDILTLVCSFFFSIHILVIDYYSPKVEGVVLSCIQFFVCGIISIIFMLIFENPVLKNILDAKIALLYAGVLSCGVAYTLQVVVQKNIEPFIASLILSLESVFSVLFGWIILQQVLSFRESIGCLLVFIAIILTQVPLKIKGKTL